MTPVPQSKQRHPSPHPIYANHKYIIHKIWRGDNSNDKKFDNGRELRVLHPVATQKGTKKGPMATLLSPVTRDITHFTVHDYSPSVAMAFCWMKPSHKNRVISKLYLSHLAHNKKPTVKHFAQKTWDESSHRFLVNWKGQSRLSWRSRYAGKVHWIARLLSGKKDLFCVQLRKRRGLASTRRLTQHSLSKSPTPY